MMRFLLDSGDPHEYREIAQLAKEHSHELWGSTTNPSLIAKKLAGQKVTFKDAFSKLQKEIVGEILTIVPGPVSAEVYASKETTGEDMVEQGKEIASWHPRVVVKLPTTLEGFKARTQLRKMGILTNNTLVFSQEQVYAICLHEKLIQEASNPTPTWPPFISPFLGRLDDQGEDGMMFLQQAMQVKNTYFNPDISWMLAASIRNPRHVKASMLSGSELATIPAQVYREWFAMSPDEQEAIALTPETKLTPIPLWHPSDILKNITSVEELLDAMEQGTLDITHPLTDAGIEKFVADWQKILL